VSFSLMPRDPAFFVLFRQHADNTQRAAVALEAMLADFTNIEEKARAIQEIEHRGDELTHEIISRVSRRFITPLDREDMLGLASRLDDVTDACLDASEMMILYKVGMIRPAALQQAQVLAAATEALAAALGGLEKLEGLETHWFAIHSLENEGDQLMRTALEELFRTETDPVEIVKWKDLHKVLEAAIDRCEDAANIIEMIVVKHR
jgi:predicted phosphate transport protein (TIGR00153 family)